MRREGTRNKESVESRLKSQLHNVSLRMADLQKELSALKNKNVALAAERDRLRANMQ